MKREGDGGKGAGGGGKEAENFQKIKNLLKLERRLKLHPLPASLYCL